MTRLASGLLGLALLVCLPAAAATQANVAGSWALEVNGPGGLVTATLELVQEGDVLTGTIDGDMGKTPIEGAVAGNLIKLNFTVDAGGQYIPIVMFAEVDGDTLTGSMDFGQGTAETTGTRTSH